MTKYKVAYCGGLMSSSGYTQPNKNNIPQITSGNTVESAWTYFNTNGKNETDADAFVFEINEDDTSTDYRPKLHVFKSKCSPNMKCYYDSNDETGKLISDKTNVWAKIVRYGNNKEIFVMTQYDDWTSPNNEYRLANTYDSFPPSPYSDFARPTSIEYLFTNKNSASNDIQESTNYGMFSGCTKLTECELPCQMRNISTATFSGCTSLTSYTKNPDFVDTINTSAFTNCIAMESIVIGKYATLSGGYNFKNCSGATSIKWSGLKTSGKKERMTEITNSCFEGCESLSATTFEDGQLNKIVIPSGITSIGSSAFAYCESIKDLELNGVTSIGYAAFRNCDNLSAITNLSSVTVIGSYAFYHGSAFFSRSPLYIGQYSFSNLTEIGSDAFYRREIQNGNNGISIRYDCNVHYQAFHDTSISGNVTVYRDIASSAFQSASISGNVTVNGNATDSAFQSASTSGNVTVNGNATYSAFTNASINGNVTVDGYAAYSAFTNAKISGSVTVDGDVASSAFQSANISGNVTVNGDVTFSAFASANTTNGIITFSGTSVGWYAFQHSNLAGLNNGTSSNIMDLSRIGNLGIGGFAFSNATIYNIDTIIFGNNDYEDSIPIGEEAFNGFNSGVSSLTLSVYGETRLEISPNTTTDVFGRELVVKLNNYYDTTITEDSPEWVKHYFNTDYWVNVEVKNANNEKITDIR